MSQMLSWMASKAKSVSRQHLEGVGAATIIILACLHIKNRVWKGTKSFHRSQLLGVLHGGRAAVQRILDSQNALVDKSDLDRAEEDLKQALELNPLDLEKLQSALVRMEMSGKEDMALKMLQPAMKSAQCQGHGHEAYELGMCIVEMLIYKGDTEEALEQTCLEQKDIQDARRPLYKMIIYIIEQKGDAKKCWDGEFNAVRDRFKCDCFHNGLTHEVMTDFDKFEKAVKLLKKEIDLACKKPR